MTLRAGDLVLLVKVGDATVSSRPELRVVSVQGRYVQLWDTYQDRRGGVRAGGRTWRFLAASVDALEQGRIYLMHTRDGETPAVGILGTADRPGWTVRVVERGP